ncbi:DNA cytosine methyltransferase [Agrobacterium tumefaciens]|uniref:DNA cytosine methyltransferase n=1 Tax=Agrobacterium tumefaciens TaxID=358 RepID=UPI001CBB8A26|nr:DNA (cytosine-5-)-methyltransferase [Agrobacterium tumefaciens]
MAEKADNMTSEDPGALMKRILANRKSIAKAQFDMIANIGRMRSTLSDDDLRSFLVVECGIPRSDLQSIFAFNETLGSFEALLRKRCVPFHVLKALIATDADTRQAALDALADGTDVDVPTVARLRRLTIRNRIGASAYAERGRQRAMTAAASKQSHLRVQALGENVATLLSEIDAFTERFVGEPPCDPNEDVVDRSEACISAAVRLRSNARIVLREFKSVYGEVELPGKGVAGFRTGSHRHKLAAAHESLNRFADGKFAWYDKFSGFAFEQGYLWQTELQDALAYLLPCDPEPASEEKTEAAKPLRFLEICAGAGGQAIGLLGAGFEPARLYDMDLNATRTLKKNWTWPVTRKRLEKVSDRDLQQFQGIDLLAGGVECRPFSQAGKQLGANDSRNLFDEAIRYVKVIRPRAFFFENVEGFADKKFLKYRASVFQRLKALDYRIGLHKLNARDFGLAQSRPRLVLVGVHKDEPGLFSLPKDGITTTMGEALADVIFPHRGLGDVVYDQWAENWLANYGSKVSTTVTSSLYKNKGKMKRRWETELGFAVDPKHVGDGPVPLGSIEDPTLLPYLTVDVARVLQGFPRTWKFEGKADRQFHQIGNAFPPQMSKAVGLAIGRALSGRMPNLIDAPPLVPFSESLSGVKGVTSNGSRRFMLNAMTIEDVEELRDSYGTKFPNLSKLRAQAKRDRRARKRNAREYQQSRQSGGQVIETVEAEDPSTP